QQHDCRRSRADDSHATCHRNACDVLSFSLAVSQNRSCVKRANDQRFLKFALAAAPDGSDRHGAPISGLDLPKTLPAQDEHNMASGVKRAYGYCPVYLGFLESFNGTGVFEMMRIETVL